ncbi:MAG: hypothetical protein PHR84_00795 [Candidatus Omnitrophica bacterium]|jgi:hypothetical protein|nr:hypothetical protein [Candidatus Omnitrophota bacterium]MDD5661447.1 hypothetical protein [Candidatus Omnitrophota bacterium]
MLRDRKAQAVLELAILGSLLIMAFSIAIKYGEQYNREQSYMQQTFRGNLKMARKALGSTSYGTTDFRRSSNMIDPMELGELQQFGSSNQVLWTHGKKDPATDEPYEAKGYYRFNRGAILEVALGPAPYNTSVTLSSHVTTSPHNETRYYKDTEAGRSSSTKWMDATDTITASMPFAGTTVSLSSDPFHDELGEGGFYKSGGIKRTKTLE